MELTQLISFFHTARLCSISKACEVVCRSQPAVSQQIKALEEEIGCKLFHRIGKRKLVVTEEGRRLRQFTRNLLDQLDHTLDDIRAIHGGNRGHVTVSAPFTTCFQILPAVLEKFSAEYPDIEISIFDKPQGAAVSMVRNGEADLAVVLDSAVPKGFHTIEWKRAVPVLLVPRGHVLAGKKNISVRDIAGQRLIIPPDRARHPGWSLIKSHASEAKIPIRGAIRSSNVELSSRLVEKGLGVSFATIIEGLPILEGRGLDVIRLDHLLPVSRMVLAARDKEIVRGAKARFIETFLAF